MPEIKLLYFPIKGRAEAIRLAFTIGRVEFTDETFPFSEFPALKESGRLPFGQVPLLTVDGKDYTQSAGMLRYAGRLSGLYPKNDDLAALGIDQFVIGIEDVNTAMRYSGKDPEGLKAARMEFIETAGPRFLGGLETQATANTASDAWLSGPSISIADLVLYYTFGNIIFGFVDHIDATYLEAFPRLMASYNAVANHPAVAAWNKDHPWKKQ
jgi:prostaglandin-H2 D-isomerase / glutathione transferase